jgi:hypothetical protein
MFKIKLSFQNTVILVLCGFALTCEKPNSRYKTEMKKISNFYHQHRASTDSLLVLVKSLRAAERDFPGKWLPHFWLGYIHSVHEDDIRMENTTDFANLDSAQIHFENAWSIGTEFSNEDKSELYVSQANMFQLKSWMYQGLNDQDNFKKYNKLTREYITKAEAANPDNPKLFVLKGIPMIYNKDETIRSQGRQRLEEGLRKYANYSPVNKHYPKWGKSLIESHMARVFGQPK